MDVTLVGNDTGGALVQLLEGDDAGGVGRACLSRVMCSSNFRRG